MSFLTDLHSHIRSTLLTRRGATMHPDDVPTGTHKEYSRMPRIALPAPEPLAMNLDAVLSNRRSSETFPLQTFSLQALGTLLGNALGVHDETRHYPSAGALYPIETYFISSCVEGQVDEVFHYHPYSHALEALWKLPRQMHISDLAQQDMVTNDRSLIVFTALWERSSKKYGDLAYAHALIEAGHMAQNVLLAATALSIPSRPFAGFKDDPVCEVLDVNPQEEQPIYALIL